MHEAYKDKMKGIVVDVIATFTTFIYETKLRGDDFSLEEVSEWADRYVEERFQPETDPELAKKKVESNLQKGHTRRKSGE